ncbi:1-hydroxycarotenoid 3,4-desaturase CrtD [Afipia sp. DC4300-2b1]|uniref:1-hydroxycarotenoid 3,4-desaturase CrtD n=1 Tax=Afipia sp. DC4300-2b1 TaxID=2804672 RepID=UPI003CFB460E
MLPVRTNRVVVVGAGIAGLTSALALAAKGLDVTLLERAEQPGGKMRQIGIGSSQIDSGPTVFTMRWVFEELFAQAGESFSDYVKLRPLDVLARHAWSESERLDLFASEERSTDAIGRFSGSDEARRYRAFCAATRRIYQILEKPFLRSASPSMGTLIGGNGMRGLVDLRQIRPFTTMWTALGQYFQDPRLRQMFGRYATYCGSSPFEAPATLMLIAHVEREGVWTIDGGIHKLATAIAKCAAKHGAKIRYGEEVKNVLTSNGAVSGVELTTGERPPADAVIMNADVAAVGSGLFGSGIAHAAQATPVRSRSLSAMTWSIVAKTEGFPLSRHSVFFSSNYRAEFDDLFRRNTMPADPTVYVCAQDRCDDGAAADAGTSAERLLVLVNAPPTGDRHVFDAAEVERCARRAFGALERCGLRIDRLPERVQVTTPNDFNRMFPATGGALYGRSSHGWTASFKRPGARTKIAGLYLAGGSTHPGPGVPMAALSGRAAASSLLEDMKSKTRGWMPAGRSRAV